MTRRLKFPVLTRLVWGLTLVLVGVSVTAAAADSPLCEDLVRYACAPGAHDDGTGVVRRADSWSEQIYKAFKQYEPKIQNQFIDVLSRSENDEFKALAMASFGMKDSPECRGASAADVSACNRAVAEGLVSLTKNELMGVESRPAFIGAQTSSAEREAVVNHRVFQTTLSFLKKTYLGLSIHPVTEKLVREEIFPKVKSLLIAKIKRIPMNEKQRGVILAKLSEIRYAGAECERNAQGLAKDYLENAYYLPAEKKFVICGGHLGKDVSEFTLARLIGHELSHSIDPCNWLAVTADDTQKFSSLRELKAQESQYPVQGLISCLRSDQSVKASRGVLNVPKGMTASYSFCKRDQITEAVADWFGVEIMAEYIAQTHPNLSEAQWQIGVANSVRHSCDGYEELMRSQSSVFEEHLRLPDKANGLILTHPKIREKMGCSPTPRKYQYCDAENPQLLQKRFPNAAVKSDGKNSAKKKSK